MEFSGRDLAEAGIKMAERVFDRKMFVVLDRIVSEMEKDDTIKNCYPSIANIFIEIRNEMLVHLQKAAPRET